MEYKSKKYKGHNIITVPAEELGTSYDQEQVYFKDGSRSKCITNGKDLIDRVTEHGYYEEYSYMYKWDKSDMEALTKENVSDFIGKRIYFFSEQYKANTDAEGIAVIDAVDLTKRKPLSCTLVKSAFDYTELSYAFVNDDNEFCIGDSDRPVMVKVL